MAANQALDPERIEQAVKVGGERTKKAAVTRGLEEYTARRARRQCRRRVYGRGFSLDLAMMS